MNKTVRYDIAIAILLAGQTVMASEAHGHGGGLDEHTIKTIIYQAINVALIIVGLTYFLKNSVRTFFKSRQSDFVALAEKSQATRKAAELEHQEIKHRLAKLEDGAGESISRARAEAVDLKKSIVAEGELLAKRIRDEAQSAAKLEVERAKQELRQDLIAEAFLNARSQIQTKVSSEDHRRLQSEFINNIQAVQR